jgi:hypothetical protein
MIIKTTRFGLISKSMDIFTLFRMVYAYILFVRVK